MADDIRQFVKNCEICQRVYDAKFIKVDFLLSHKCGTRYFVCAHILIHMLDLFLLCIMTGMSMVMVKRLRSGHKHQTLSGILGFIIVLLIIQAPIHLFHVV